VLQQAEGRDPQSALFVAAVIFIKITLVVNQSALRVVA
jgi:hypothetical protein